MTINVGPQASDFLVRDWLMMLMMSLTNGGFERCKVRLVLVDEFSSLYSEEKHCNANVHMASDEKKFYLILCNLFL